MAFFAFFLVLLQLPLTGQAGKENYALLWKISGNGLSHPSYLFGTMHLRDNRVFEFSDSVLVKLDACEAFASEMRIDSSICQLLQLFEYGDTTNVLKNTLPEYTYRKINKALMEKIGLRIENLDVKEPQNIEALLSEDQELYFEEDREEELDFYLFKRAYLQGKPLYGLEYERDVNHLVEAYFREFEINYQAAQAGNEAQEEANMLRLLEFYRTGNLDSIAAYSIADEHYSDYDY